MKITSYKNGTVLYHCDSCGTHGKCMIRPLGKADILVVDIRCPNCWDTERVTLLQYSTWEERERLKDQLAQDPKVGDVDVSGTLVFNNQVISKGD